jgi:ADP-dependent NAD(P)H-hydrate dehydratase / NAD(P)H-hydrate epimerase
MKILLTEQIREADAATIRLEPIAGIDLMERASTACTEWIIEKYTTKESFYIFCGMGNNGGDGLAIGRLLLQRKFSLKIFILKSGSRFSPDCATNLERLKALIHPVFYLNEEKEFPAITPDTIIIDALFGTGLTRPLTGVAASLVKHINHSPATVIAVDLPSGLFPDQSSINSPIINANYTLSFQTYKLAFLMPENEEKVGKVHILPIGINEDFINQTETPFNITDKNIIQQIYRPRKIFSHKGNYGHAILLAGNFGKMGAAVLASKACLHAGTGLLTTAVPREGYEIIQITNPEAMCVVYDKQSMPADLFGSPEKYSSVGIGPGIGTSANSLKILEAMLEWYQRPMVIDADALNLLSVHPELLEKVPPFSMLTPHPKEFERLFGKTISDFERLDLLRDKAKKHQVFILLKGHYSCIACPDGLCFFNPTGNPGMATGGSGDVLTGILTGLMAQGYSSRDTVILGAYLHGMAGDIAAENISQEAMLAGDITGYLGNTFKKIQREK